MAKKEKVVTHYYWSSEPRDPKPLMFHLIDKIGPGKLAAGTVLAAAIMLVCAPTGLSCDDQQKMVVDNVKTLCEKVCSDNDLRAYTADALKEIHALNRHWNPEKKQIENIRYVLENVKNKVIAQKFKEQQKGVQNEQGN
jgi:hypothetical protein